MTDEQMKIELVDFFDAMKNILGYDKPQDLKNLKNILKNKSQERIECIYLYRAWSIAELCCASPEWKEESLRGICSIDIHDDLCRGLLCCVFSELAKTKIHAINEEICLCPAIDIRLRLLDTLKRIELAQALNLGVMLYTLEGKNVSLQNSF